jgi:hypothetical protein
MANRSTGPRSVEGKAVSRRNALKSGIYASAETVLESEDPKKLEALTAEYYGRFATDDPEQRCLVDSLVSDEWLLRRFRVIEAQLLSKSIRDDFLQPEEDYPLGKAYNFRSGELDRLQRRINATRRSYERTLKLLRELQPPATPQQAPEFVPSKPRPQRAKRAITIPSPQSPPPAPGRRPPPLTPARQ